MRQQQLAMFDRYVSFLENDTHIGCYYVPDLGSPVPNQISVSWGSVDVRAGVNGCGG